MEVLSDIYLGVRSEKKIEHASLISQLLYEQ